MNYTYYMYFLLSFLQFLYCSSFLPFSRGFKTQYKQHYLKDKFVPVFEEKTIKFEEKRLKKLRINKKPSWDGFENNLLGYDVQSWKTNSKKIFIEVKASSYSNGTFFLTRNEWNFSLSVKDDFFIHLWIQDENNPRIISFQELHSKNYRIEDASNSEWTNIRIVPVKIN